MTTVSTAIESRISRAQRSAPQHLLSLGELTPAEFKSLLDLAEVLKAERNVGSLVHQIPGASLAVVFEKPSTRTRVSFDVAMYELGGHAVVLSTKELQAARGETPEDTARALSQFCGGIAARVNSHSTLLAFAKSATVPVVNALSDLYHPCQTIADLLTVRQHKKKLKGVKLVWVGDGNNVCNSLMIGCALSGMDMHIACPKEFGPLEEAVSISKAIAEHTGSHLEITSEADQAVKNADVVATDTFVSMGKDDERNRRLEIFLPEYQVNEQLIELAKSDAIFLHCLPAHRGEEVTAGVIDGPQSVVWQEAENRLHGQKALLYTLLRGKGRKAE